MPTQTFHNLPPDKREKIVELALEEFSERPYAQASLSRIVARAGIAKGSIYQYFTDKFDLYRWLIVEEVGRRKQAFIGEASPVEGDLRTRLRAMCIAGLRFALTYPRLARVAAHAAAPGDEPALRALHAEMRAISRAGLEGLLRDAQAAGELRADLALGPAAAVLTAALGEGMMNALLERLGLTLPEYLADTGLAARLSPEATAALIDSVLDVLWHGIAAKI
jgi:AcrR family transcriptional regulator